MKNEKTYEREILKIIEKYSSGSNRIDAFLIESKWIAVASEIEQFYIKNNNINRFKLKIKRLWNKLINKLIIK